MNAVNHPTPPASNPPEEPRSFGQLVRARRKALGLTLDELAVRIGRTKGFLSQLENDRRRPPRDEILAHLNRALGLPPGTLEAAARWAQAPPNFRREISILHNDRERRDRILRQLREILAATAVDEQGRIQGSLDEAYRTGNLRALIDRLVPPDGAPEQSTQRPYTGGLGASVPLSMSLEVPIINSVAAGYPREFTDLGYPARVADEYVRCPDLTDPDAFAARVVGDSMNPTYAEGDIVIFSPAKPVKDGCDCFVRLEPGHETTFKRVYSESDPEGHAVIRLQPLNSAFAPRVLARELVAAMFAAVNVIKRVP